MPYWCVNGCGKEAIFDSNICDSCLEDAAIKNQENFGTPERYMCGYCGDTFSPQDIVRHIKRHLDDQD